MFSVTLIIARYLKKKIAEISNKILILKLALMILEFKPRKYIKKYAKLLTIMNQNL
jgi:hypothetical protein